MVITSVLEQDPPCLGVGEGGGGGGGAGYARYNISNEPDGQNFLA